MKACPGASSDDVMGEFGSSTEVQSTTDGRSRFRGTNKEGMRSKYCVRTRSFAAATTPELHLLLK